MNAVSYKNEKFISNKTKTLRSLFPVKKNIACKWQTQAQINFRDQKLRSFLYQNCCNCTLSTNWKGSDFRLNN